MFINLNIPAGLTVDEFNKIIRNEKIFSNSEHETYVNDSNKTGMYSNTYIDIPKYLEKGLEEVFKDEKNMLSCELFQEIILNKHLNELYYRAEVEAYIDDGHEESTFWPVNTGLIQGTLDNLRKIGWL